MTTARQRGTAPGATLVGRNTLDLHARPGVITSPGKHADLLDPLPNDVTALAGFVPGLSIHEYLASSYGVSIPDARKSETHIRKLGQMLDRLLAQDNHPLNEARRMHGRTVPRAGPMLRRSASSRVICADSGSSRAVW